MSASTDRFRIVIVAPVFRDWESASLLCRSLDEAFAALPGARVSLLLIDDGSPDGLAGWEGFTPAALHAIDALMMRRNLGHQRAIATALCHVHANIPCDAVIVMDADGEDRPADALALARKAMERPRIVFAERRRRPEQAWFRVGYHAYRLLHRVLTGVPVRVGNFSVLPAAALSRLTCMPELWNHYVGAVFRSKLPFDTLPMDRGTRFRGSSRMDLIALVNHGLSGIATFHDVVATRLLLGATAAIGLVIAALALVTGIRLGTDLAIPGWATMAAGLLLLVLGQCLAIAISTAFMLMTSRTSASFVPCRDSAIFVERVTSLSKAT